MFNLIEGTIVNNNYYFIIGVLLILVLVFFYLKKRPKKATVNEKLISELKEIFSLDNVVDIQSETSRVKFTVKDVEKVDLKRLKEISDGVFISQNSIKVMFKDNATLIVNALGNYYK